MLARYRFPTWFAIGFGVATLGACESVTEDQFVGSAGNAGTVGQSAGDSGFPLGGAAGGDGGSEAFGGAYTTSVVTAGAAGTHSVSEAGASGSGGNEQTAGAAGQINKPGGPCTPDMPFIFIEAVDELNSENMETNAKLTSDGLSVYFSSDQSRTDSAQRALPYTDIYVATRARVLDAEGKPERFGKPRLVTELCLPPTTPDLDASVSRDGKTVFFDTYRPRRAIWRATLSETGLWQNLEHVSILSGAGEDMHPHLAPDGSGVYFTSSRTADKTGFDLYYSPIVMGEVRTPAPVSVNTRDGEARAVVSPNELTLYFSSTRVRPGPDQKRGHSDIWMAERKAKTEPFAEPKFLGEISSRATDEPSDISEDGCTLYFDSERGDGQGKSDIYRAYRRLP